MTEPPGETSRAAETLMVKDVTGAGSSHPRHPAYLLSLVGLATCMLGAAALAGSYHADFSVAADITPAGLLAASILLVTALLSRVRLIPRLIAGMALLLFGVVAWPETTALAIQSATRTSDTKTLKVLTANVWSDNNDRVSFLDYIRAEQPDVIVVVEAYKFWLSALQTLEPHYRVAAGCTLPHECDVVILTNLEVGVDQPPQKSARVVARLILPKELGGHPFQVMGLHLNRPLTVLNVPPDLSDLYEAVSVADGFGPMDFAAGDFNATPWGARLRHFDANVPLARHTRWLATWPATLANRGLKELIPVAPIDHIYAGESWRVVDIERGPDIGSDHYPVLATFSLDRH
jgi:endonuclease/exonuclease/phosphatase (EEP) superfamily protein YafD